MTTPPLSLTQLARAILCVVDSLAEADTQQLPSLTEIERDTLEKVAARLQQIAGQGA